MAPTLEFVGTPFSTFTRTIAMGLHYKGLQFKHTKTPPHSDIALRHHPFGYLPSLVIDGSTSLDESQAIARYIERIAPLPTLELSAKAKEAGILEEKVWEFVSLAASFGFPKLEGGIIKPYVKSLDDPNFKVLDEPIEELAKAAEFLSVIESQMVQGSKYAFGDEPTWADFYLYPILADLRFVPAHPILSDRLSVWLASMDELEVAKKTEEGTWSLGGRT